MASLLPYPRTRPGHCPRAILAAGRARAENCRRAGVRAAYHTAVGGAV